MAYTRIHGIKTTLNKALAYIENPEKTEHQLLVSGYNVDPLAASVEFSMTAALGREVKGDHRRTGGADNLAYHMIQSFAPYDKVTPEAAHELGKQWADEVLQGKYEYVISTHVDKGHIHNHIIFNATSFLDFGKYDNYKVAGHLRAVSDRLCEERGLYVIQDPARGRGGKTHYEWEQWRQGTSWKAQIGRIIDAAIARTDNYSDFKAELTRAGVEIKEGARISFRLTGEGQQRFCRGDRIGDTYSRDGIMARLAQPLEVRKAQAAKNAETFDRRIARAVRKAQLAETQEMAAALVTIRREGVEHADGFDSKIAELKEKVVQVRATIQDYDTKSQHYQRAAKYLMTYRDYAPLAMEREHQTIFTRTGFVARHEQELAAWEHAVKQLERMGVNTNVDPEKVLELVKQQVQHSEELHTEIDKIDERIDALKKAKEVVARVERAEDPREPAPARRQQERG